MFSVELSFFISDKHKLGTNTYEKGDGKNVKVTCISKGRKATIVYCKNIKSDFCFFEFLFN